MVLLEDSVKTLITQWNKRKDIPDQPSDYKIALSECIYDLQNCINNLS